MKIEAALAADDRPEKDVIRDKNRKPAETLEFFGLCDVMKVVELLPGTGWYTRVLPPVARENGFLSVAYGTGSVEERLLTTAGPAERFEVHGSARAIETESAAQMTAMVDVARDTRFNRASSGLTSNSDSVATDRNSARWHAFGEPLSVGEPKPNSPNRLLRAELLQRVFELDALRCPRCGGRMRVLSAIINSTVAAGSFGASDYSRAHNLWRHLAIVVGHLRSAGVVGFGGISRFDFDQSQAVDDCESSA